MRSRAYYAWTPTAAARCSNSGHGTLGGGPKNEATTYRASIARPFHHGTAGRSTPLQLRASGPAHFHSIAGIRRSPLPAGRAAPVQRPERRSGRP